MKYAILAACFPLAAILALFLLWAKRERFSAFATA